MPEIVLIRGLPGSGKTTAAQAMSGHVHVEADMYFMNNGTYVYAREKVPDAHRWCLEQAMQALAAGHNVVVANTFVKKWEMEPYFALGYPVTIRVMTGRFQNVHGIPADVIEAMARRWEP